MISSMIFLGIDSSSIEVFNDEHQRFSRRPKNNEGAFRLTTGIAMCAMIRNFQFHELTDVVLIPPNARIRILSREPDNFRGEADSLQFV
ncbi:MAG TPA: hypothetical protein VEW46_22175 [Pyrinomonadaceae bacterium]|nr:hypothetical protein [Pyrinomonadaceae bacterium]